MPHWTEAIAVGSEAFVRSIAQGLKRRRRIKMDDTADGSWTVREPGTAGGWSMAADDALLYEPDSTPKIVRVDDMWVLTRS